VIPAPVAQAPALQTPALQQAEPRYPVPYEDSPQPIRLTIPALEVAADVQPVGMSDSVTMQVPSDISTIGWFDRSVLPTSDTGHTVLAGHKDGVSDPNGVFRNLGNVLEGDVVKVLDQSGRRMSYEVTKVEVLGNQQFAQEAPWIFKREGEHRLVLITCGGDFDESRGGYQANVVVVAKRA
jgi:LPXTG-site transpeptidase (sortase) family protein